MKTSIGAYCGIAPLLKIIMMINVIILIRYQLAWYQKDKLAMKTTYNNEINIPEWIFDYKANI